MKVAGIDCGTQSTKVIVYDAEAKQIVASAQASHGLIAGEDGTREQKAEWWISALETCFAAIPADVRSQIAALGVSGQQHGFVPVGKNGVVLANVKLWNDTSTAPECDEIHETLGGSERATELAGNPILPGYTASKVLWLKNRNPEAYRELETILLPHDFLNLFLTGNVVMEFGDASGTGFLDVRERSWCREVLSAIDTDRDLSTCLPELVDAHEPAGFVTSEAAKRLGLSNDIVVSSGGGDNMMGAIGTGAVRDGAITMSLGTSGTLYGFADKPIVPELEEFAAFCSSTGGWLPLVCTMNCTSSSELIRELFNISLGAFDQVLGEAPPGADGIVALPFFGGERTPNLPKGKASLIGMTTNNLSRENILRSIVESTVYGLYSGLQGMKKVGMNSERIQVIGGGSNSRIWLQIVADIFNIKVVVPMQDESAAFGAALQALWCSEIQAGNSCGIATITEEHVAFDSDRVIRPIAENVERYIDAYQEYCEKLEAVAPLYA